MQNSILLVFKNNIIITGAVAWICSQAAKTIIYLIINKSFVPERLIGDGGMPSSHSATVSAVAVAAGIECGFDSPVFALALFLALIVMHDAMGVRLETGKQAKVINNMIEMFQTVGAGDLTPEEALKEFVGHTPLQVFAGCGLGIVAAILMQYFVFQEL